MVGWLMNGELECTWKEEVAAFERYYLEIHSKKLKKNRIMGVPAKIRTGHVSSTGQKRYRLSQLVKGRDWGA
jgi:hypothetical protein